MESGCRDELPRLATRHQRRFRVIQRVRDSLSPGRLKGVELYGRSSFRVFALVQDPAHRHPPYATQGSCRTIGRLWTSWVAVVIWLAVAIAAAAITIGALAEFSVIAARRIERAVPPQGRFLDLDGERLHFLDVGAGAPLVLIHGLAGQMGNFTHSLVERLSGEFRVVAFDRPGSGYSTRAEGSPAGVRAQAATLAKAIHMLGLGPAVIVGHSLGGAVALAVALDHPGCTRAVALIAPLTHPVEKPPLLFLGLAMPSQFLRRLIAWTLATPVSLLGQSWGARQVFAPEKAPADFATAGGALLGLRPLNILSSSSDMIAANDDLKQMVPRYPSLRVPVGVIYGRGDVILDWHVQGEAMQAELPTLDLEIVDGGHMLPVTCPDLVAAFLRRIAAKAVAPALEFAARSLHLTSLPTVPLSRPAEFGASERRPYREEPRPMTAKTAPRVAVIGSNNFDLVTYVTRMPLPGETIEALDFEMGYGGKGANQAVAAARLGANVLMLTAVGDDMFADQTVANLARNGIDTTYVKRVKGRSSGVAPIFVEPSGENSILIVKGANSDLSPADIESATGALKTCSLILLQLEISLETVYAAIAFGKRHGVKTLLVPAPATADLDPEKVRDVSYLMPNETELASLTGLPVETEPQVAIAARSLIAKGVETIVVTLGSRGALLVTADGVHKVEPVRVKPVDTTGAGDAFVGAFVRYFAGGDSLEEALAQAALYAADSVTRRGTQKSYATEAEFAAFRSRAKPMAG